MFYSFWCSKYYKLNFLSFNKKNVLHVSLIFKKCIFYFIYTSITFYLLYGVINDGLKSKCCNAIEETNTIVKLYNFSLILSPWTNRCNYHIFIQHHCLFFLAVNANFLKYYFLVDDLCSILFCILATSKVGWSNSNLLI